MLQSAVHSEERTVLRFVGLVNLDRSMVGLGKAVAEAIALHKDVRVTQWDDIVSGLGNENKNAAIVAFTKKALDSPYSQRVARIIAYLPDETYKLVELELENALIAKNDIAEVIKNLRKEHKRKRAEEAAFGEDLEPLDKD